LVLKIADRRRLRKGGDSEGRPSAIFLSGSFPRSVPGGDVPDVRVPAILVCVVVSACAVTPPEVPSNYPSPPSADRAPEVTVLVSDIARRHRLVSSYDADRNRLEMNGKKGEVVLYPGTTVAVVNGARIPDMGTVRGGIGAFRLRVRDAARLEKALESGDGRGSGAVVRKEDPVRVAAPDPSWRVPLERTWRYVVIHHSGTRSGCAEEFHRHHRDVRGWDGLGYHFVIGNGTGSRDGQVEVGYRWPDQLTGAHAGRAPNGSNEMNETGIGICLVGDLQHDLPTRMQKRALRRLIGFLAAYCEIPENRVLLHKDVKVTTDCPGRHFPAGEFVNERRSVPRAFRQRP
jgi:hypothetical protein